MAYDNPHGFRVVGSYGPNDVMMLVVQDYAGVYIGDAVKEGSTSGTIIRMTDQDTTVPVVGISLGYCAAAATTNDGTYKIPVMVNPNIRLAVQVANDSTNVQLTDVFDPFLLTWSGTPSGQYSNMELQDVTNSGGQFVLWDVQEGPQHGGGTLPAFGSANCEAIVTLRYDMSVMNQLTYA